MLRECSKFARHVVVAYADKLHDGTPEDLEELHRVKPMFPHVTFVQYHINPVDELMEEPELTRRTAYWCNRSRWEALAALDPACEYVLVLDADEVPEGDRMKAFVQQLDTPAQDTPALKLANYWYMREPTLRLGGIEDSAVLVPRHRLISRDAVMLCNQERNDLAYEPVVRQVTDGTPRPMIHHYSWVRTPDNLLKKVQVWSHCDDRDWVSAVRHELTRPILPGHTDVIFGRQYDTVPDPFGIVLS